MRASRRCSATCRSSPGGWTLDAAAAVSQVDEVSTVQLHSALLDSSLIVRRGPAGEPRFGMLETIRLFAGEELERSGEGETTGDRHAAYYRDLALAAGADLWGPAQLDWLDRLHIEHDNVHVDLAHRPGKALGLAQEPVSLVVLSLERCDEAPGHQRLCALQGEGHPDLVRDEPRVLVEPLFPRPRGQPPGDLLGHRQKTHEPVAEPVQPDALERAEEELLDLIRVPA